MLLFVLETGSFTFYALHHTQQEGLRALRAAWKTHCKQTGAAPRYINEAIKGGDVNIFEIQPGQVLRDGQHVRTSDS